MSEPNTVQTPEPTLRDDLRSAVETLKEKPEHAADAGKISDAERARDEAGRFAPKAKEPDAAKDAKDKRPVLTLPDKKPADGQASAQTTPAAEPKYKPPEGWTAPMKAKFGELSEDVQAEITRRETESHKRIAANDDERVFGKQFREAMEPYRAILTAEGAQPLDAFKQFLNIAYIMRTGSPEQKKQALIATANHYRVDLGAQLQPAPAVDPRLETMQQRIDRIERERTAETQARQAQEKSELDAMIQAFKATPGHDHFAQVETRMGHLLESGLAKDLQDAYDQACWSDPGIRSTLAAQNQSDAEQKRQADLKAKADAAKRAAVSVTGAPGGARPAQNANGADLSLKDQLREAFRASTGRI